MQSKRVKLELTNDEALVLYDWLARFNQRDMRTLRIKPRSVYYLTWKQCWRRPL